jgi:dihydroorotate dehydrogenase electron transfer subunit
MLVDVDAVVLSNTQLSHDYNTVSLAAPQLAVQAQPGQFVMVKATAGDHPLLRRPFSVFEILRDDAGRTTGFSLLNKRIGVTTRALYAVRAGDHVRCLGPLGRPFSLVTPPEHAWMVAGGVGLAPFATLATSLRARQVDTTLFYGGRRAEDLFYADMFGALGVHLRLSTDDGSRGDHGNVTVPLRTAFSSIDRTSPLRLYACGPTPMMRAVTELAASEGRNTDVSLEQVMGCGLGGCYSCVVPLRSADGTRFVRSCLEGPIFDGGSVDWGQLSQ